MPPTAAIEQPQLLDYLPLPPQPMSEDEFVNWCEDATYAEWVNGEVVLMSPVSPRHCEICNFLNTLLTHVARSRGLGKVFSEPFQVRLPTGTRRAPDVWLVRTDHLHLLTNNELDGPPDLAMEIVSADSVTRDRREKFIDYQSSGVGEYWMVDPMTQRLEAYRLGGDKRYARIAESADGLVASTVLPGFRLRPQWLWQEPLPLATDALREMSA